MLPALELVDLNSQVMGEGAPTVRKLLPLWHLVLCSAKGWNMESPVIYTYLHAV